MCAATPLHSVLHAVGHSARDLSSHGCPWGLFLPCVPENAPPNDSGGFKQNEWACTLSMSIPLGQHELRGIRDRMSLPVGICHIELVDEVNFTMDTL